MTTPSFSFEDPSEDPSRELELELELEGEVWKVSVAGAARVGFPADAGAPLLILHFHRGSGPPSPEREAMVPGRTLSRLSYDQILEAFQRSRPFVPPSAMDGAGRGSVARDRSDSRFRE